jgi:hypothetical protein
MANRKKLDPEHQQKVKGLTDNLNEKTPTIK